VAQLNSLLGTSLLQPASYLVSATQPMSTTNIVSSATANIARGGITAGLYDQDQDAVLTREIVSFTATTNNPDAGSIVQGNSFLDHARFAGLTLRNGVWYNSNGTPVKTGDAFVLNLWIFMVLAAFVCLVLLVRTYFKPAAAARRGGGGSGGTGGTGSGSVATNGSSKAKKRARGKWFMFTMLLALTLMLALPMSVFAAQPTAGGGATTMQIEYRYTEGQTPNIQQNITQYGQTYHLTSQTAPVLESTLPQTRTYNYRVEGALTPDQMAEVEALGNITLTPEDLVFEREVDKVTTMNMKTNDVDDIAMTKSFQVTSGTDPSGYEMKDLDRVGVTFDLANPALDSRGMPAGYVATVIYRGVETYTAVGYYYAAATFTSTEDAGGLPVYVIVASYDPDNVPTDAQVFTPTGISDNPTPAAALPPGLLDTLGNQSGNPLTDILNNNVPLGGLAVNITGVWSVLSLIMAAAGIVIAAVFAIGAIMKRKQLKELSELGAYDEAWLATVKRRSNILRILTIILGAITLLTWLFLDNFDLGMVWINGNTLLVGILFIVTIALCVLTNIRDKKLMADRPEEETSGEERSA